MKGYQVSFNGEKRDCPPCFFCKHRNEPTVSVYCYDCIGPIDLAGLKPNHQTEFAHFEPMTEYHEKVLLYEQSNFCTKEGE